MPTTATPRRTFLRAGAGLAVAGFSLGGRLDAAVLPALPNRGRAKSCILVYLLGGPPHLDTFDLKPEAPAEIRGPFKAISTHVNGTFICEHLPRLAGLADRWTVIRSVSHPNSNHTPMIYYTLTGRETAIPNQDNDVRPPQPGDSPHTGAVAARLLGAPLGLPGFVAIPELAVRSSTQGEFKRTRTPLRGGSGGFLGPASDPLCVQGDPGTAGAIPALDPPEGINRERLERRLDLFNILDRRRGASPETTEAQEVMNQAVAITGHSQGGRPVFSLDSEPAAVRERYGNHRFGRAMLLARRLAEAGVPMVAIHFNEMTVCDGWDTHAKNFEGLEKELLPMLDQSLSALVSDLADRGRLDETLIVCMGEFGRTPKINANAGRDHWGDCSSTWLCGGGVRGGEVMGASDRIGAYPTRDRVDPVDVQATVYQLLGLDPRQHLTDALGRPWALSLGKALDV
jgi:hypothetical protein